MVKVHLGARRALAIATHGVAPSGVMVTPTLLPTLLAARRAGARWVGSGAIALALAAGITLLITKGDADLAASSLGLSNVLWFVPPASVRRTDGLGQALLDFGAYWLLLLIPMLGLSLLGWHRAGLRPWLLAIGSALFPLYGLLFPLVEHGGDPSFELLEYFWATGPAYKGGEVLGTLPFYALGRALRGLGQFSRTSDLDFTRLLSVIGVIGAAGLWCLAVRVSCGGLTRPFRLRLRHDRTRWILACAVVFQPIGIMLAGFVQTTYVLSVLAPWVVLAFVSAFSRGMPRVGPSILAITLAAIAYFAHGVAVTILLAIAAGLATLSLRAIVARAWSAAARAMLLLLFLLITYRLLTGAINAVIRTYHLGGKLFPWADEFGSLQAALSGFQTITHKWPAWMPFATPWTTCGQQTALFSGAWLLFSFGAVTHVSNLPALVACARRWRTACRASTSSAFIPFAIASALGFVLAYSPHYSYPQDLDIILFPGLVMSSLSLVGLASGTASECGGPSVGAVPAEVQAGPSVGTRLAVGCLMWSTTLTAGLWALQFTYVNESFARGLSWRVCG